MIKKKKERNAPISFKNGKFLKSFLKYFLLTRVQKTIYFCHIPKKIIFGSFFHSPPFIIVNVFSNKRDSDNSQSLLCFYFFFVILASLIFLLATPFNILHNCQKQYKAIKVMIILIIFSHLLYNKKCFFKTKERGRVKTLKLYMFYPPLYRCFGFSLF